VIAYVDGFNLYHGLHQMSGRRDLWLDIPGLLSASFVDSARGQELIAVHYFTAAVHGQGQSRQDTYLRALIAHRPEVTVHLGHYLRKTVVCRQCGNSRTVYEEKESDVALAVQLVQDASLGAYERALLVSADSDMCPAVRSARTVAPDRQVVAVFPPRRSSMELTHTANHAVKIFDRAPRRHQLPTTVIAASGSKYHRPEYWA
jgi:uncharacterized LabA/DUF88 family protein